ncbi:hypothetical protein ACHAXT_005985 [Thalassiosira profunda]
MTLSAHRSTKAPRHVPHHGPCRRPRWWTRGVGRAASAAWSGFQRVALALAGGRARPRVENGLVRAPDAAAVARAISSAEDQQQGEDQRGDGGGASPAVVDAGSAESAGAQNIQPNVHEPAREAADAGEALRVGAAGVGEDGEGVAPNRPQRAEPHHQRAPLRPIQAERPLGARSVDGDVAAFAASVAGAPKSKSTTNPSSRSRKRPASTTGRENAEVLSSQSHQENALSSRSIAAVRRAHAKSDLALARLRQQRLEEERRLREAEERRQQLARAEAEERLVAQLERRDRRRRARWQANRRIYVEGCAATIQRHWRGFAVRRRLAGERGEEAVAQVVGGAEDVVAAGECGVGEDAALAGDSPKEDVSSGEVLDVLSDEVLDVSHDTATASGDVATGAGRGNGSNDGGNFDSFGSDNAISNDGSGTAPTDSDGFDRQKELVGLLDGADVPELEKPDARDVAETEGVVAVGEVGAGEDAVLDGGSFDVRVSPSSDDDGFGGNVLDGFDVDANASTAKESTSQTLDGTNVLDGNTLTDGFDAKGENATLASRSVKEEVSSGESLDVLPGEDGSCNSASGTRLAANGNLLGGNGDAIDEGSQSPDSNDSKRGSEGMDEEDLKSGDEDASAPTQSRGWKELETEIVCRPPDEPILAEHQLQELKGLANSYIKLNHEKSQAVDDFGPDSDKVAAIEESRLAADRKVLTRACYLLGSRPGECPDRQSPLAKRIRKAGKDNSLTVEPARKRSSVSYEEGNSDAEHEEASSGEATARGDDGESEEEEGLGCVCGCKHRQPKDFWIQCDGCNAWHKVAEKCVEFDEEAAEALDAWFCWSCKPPKRRAPKKSKPTAAKRKKPADSEESEAEEGDVSSGEETEHEETPKKKEKKKRRSKGSEGQQLPAVVMAWLEEQNLRGNKDPLNAVTEAVIKELVADLKTSLVESGLDEEAALAEILQRQGKGDFSLLSSQSNGLVEKVLGDWRVKHFLTAADKKALTQGKTKNRWWRKRWEIALPLKSKNRAGKDNIQVGSVSATAKSESASGAAMDAQMKGLGLNIDFGENTERLLMVLEALRSKRRKKIHGAYRDFKKTARPIALKVLQHALQLLATKKETTVAAILNGMTLSQFIDRHLQDGESLEDKAKAVAREDADEDGFDDENDDDAKRLIQVMSSLRELNGETILVAYENIVDGLIGGTIAAVQDKSRRWRLFVKVGEKMVREFCIGGGTVGLGFDEDEFSRGMTTDSYYAMEMFSCPNSLDDCLVVDLNASDDKDATDERHRKIPIPGTRRHARLVKVFREKTQQMTTFSLQFRDKDGKNCKISLHRFVVLVAEHHGFGIHHSERLRKKLGLEEGQTFEDLERFQYMGERLRTANPLQWRWIVAAHPST